MNLGICATDVIIQLNEACIKHESLTSRALRHVM